ILQQLRVLFPFFGGGYQGWKDSVRHNLSSNPCFAKVLKDPSKPHSKGNFWTVDVSRIRRRRCGCRTRAVARGALGGGTAAVPAFVPDLAPFVLSGCPYPPPATPKNPQNPPNPRPPPSPSIPCSGTAPPNFRPFHPKPGGAPRSGRSCPRPNSAGVAPNAVAPNAVVPIAGVAPNAVVPNTGVPNAVVPDAGVPNAVVPNTGVPNAVVPDAGVPNAMVPNAGVAPTFGEQSPNPEGDFGGGPCPAPNKSVFDVWLSTPATSPSAGDDVTGGAPKFGGGAPESVEKFWGVRAQKWQNLGA
ncbi:forkhead box protein H1, partial [Melospiza melodia melodia]|uniref:forkhead box protein H1 n=1 Tax=Melospiza melodia melodia TaxID=1914991 RepID=UPI002FD083AC